MLLSCVKDPYILLLCLYYVSDFWIHSTLPVYDLSALYAVLISAYIVTMA